MRFTIFQDSHIGGRKSNQDRLAYSYSKDVLLLVIADGMGGHARGEIAAEIAVNTMTNRFQQEARTALRRPKEFLESSILSAHRAIVAFADKNDMLECPRTTIVGCVVQHGKACWAHSGDSRLYCVRDGQIAIATADHSRVRQLIDAGAISEAQALVHPDRNKIYNCLGGVLPPMVTHSEEWALKVGDTLLLCTDGFWGPLNADFIAAKLQREDILSLVPKLLDEAQRKAGAESDNLSVIGLTWEHQEVEDPSPSTVTVTEPIEGFQTSTMNSTQQITPFRDDISDEEIQKAISEIQDAIKRAPK
jgi:serine/threonine protein phosphatase PrpC